MLLIKGFISELLELGNITVSSKINVRNNIKRKRHLLVDAEKFIELYRKDPNSLTGADFIEAPLESESFGKFRIPLNDN
jgi:hypothetical protein